MGAWDLILTVAIVLLWSRVSTLRRRLDRAERELTGYRAERAGPMPASGPVREAVVRAARDRPVDAASHGSASTASEPAAPPPSAPEPPRPVAAIPVPPAATPSAPVATPRPPAAAPVATAAATPVATPAPAAAAPVTMPPTSTTPPVYPPIAAASPVSTADIPRDNWEVVVGASWLNKIGVVVFVIGMALLVGYSVMHVGPLGRILIGFAISAAMLSTGVIVERQPVYRSYAHGLVAGGWAGIYFTTYAMHAIPASRVITSDLVGISALVAVAAGMIVHSLRYGSETITGLAYVTGYATLLVTPLSDFSLVASVPLTASLLAVASRRAWTGVKMLGIVSTYGLLAWRIEGALAHDSPMPSGIWPTLALFWVMFEAADQFAIARRTGTKPPPPSLFALNAIGALGAGFLIVPSNGPSALFRFLTVAALAYATSAVLRLRLTPASVSEQPTSAGTAQAAVAIAAGLAAWAVDTRFSGVRETLALLLETQFLVVAGLVAGDRHIRQTGAVLGMFVLGHHLGVAHATQGQTPIVVSLLLMAAWYGNRESLRSRALVPIVFEHTYTWGALLVGAFLIDREVSPAFQGLAALIFAALLLEAGLRRGHEYRFQAYVSGLIGALAVMMAFGFGIGITEPRHVWTVLPAATALAYGMAWRLARKPTPAELPAAERTLAAGVAGWFGLIDIATFEWRTCAPETLTLVWTATALAVIVIGTFRRVMGLRWQGYALAFFAALGTVPSLFGVAPHGVLYASATIVLLYAATLVSKRALVEVDPHDTAVQLEDFCRTGLSIIATLLLTTLIVEHVRASLVTLAWALEGTALLVTGFAVRERVLRLSGLTLLFVCILKLFVSDLSQLEALARILSFVVLGLVLLAISWAYTRFREQIRKLL